MSFNISRSSKCYSPARDRQDVTKYEETDCRREMLVNSEVEREVVTGGGRSARDTLEIAFTRQVSASNLKALAITE